MRIISYLLAPIIGAVVGFRLGQWWLDRTVAIPELEGAVYPGVGALVGATLGLFLLVLVVWLRNGRPGDR